jgi:hypothetical protein
VRDSQSLFDRAGILGMAVPLAVLIAYCLSRCVQLEDEVYGRLGRIDFTFDERQFRAQASLEYTLPFYSIASSSLSPLENIAMRESHVIRNGAFFPH